MNKIVRQLEKQCWSHRINGVLIDGHLHFDSDKFAKLIIRECAQLSANNFGYGGLNISYMILDHFGVSDE